MLKLKNHLRGWSGISSWDLKDKRENTALMQTKIPLRTSTELCLLLRLISVNYRSHYNVAYEAHTRTVLIN